jgi:uncharacterized protein YndB with AHSA1/START domain
MRKAAHPAPSWAHEIVLTRTFAAPRRLVFAAITKPAFLAQWFAPPGWTLVACEVDLRVGGGWHMMLRSPAGVATGMRGVYHEIVSPARIVDTECFDGFPAHALRTTVLVEDCGKTTLTTTLRCGLRPGANVPAAVLAERNTPELSHPINGLPEPRSPAHPPAPFWQNEFPSKTAFRQRLARSPHNAMPPSTRWVCPVM